MDRVGVFPLRFTNQYLIVQKLPANERQATTSNNQEQNSQIYATIFPPMAKLFHTLMKNQ